MIHSLIVSPSLGSSVIRSRRVWAILSSPASIRNWRNQLLDMLKTLQTQAVIAFGAGAGLHATWNTWLSQIRPNVTPDPGVTPDMTPYTGSTFTKADLENIPPRDLPFGVPK